MVVLEVGRYTKGKNTNSKFDIDVYISFESPRVCTSKNNMLKWYKIVLRGVLEERPKYDLWFWRTAIINKHHFEYQAVEILLTVYPVMSQ